MATAPANYISSPSAGLRTPPIHIGESRMVAARLAAQEAAGFIRSVIRLQGRARIMVGTGNSQQDMVNFLVREGGIDWSKVEAFHLDEYVGIKSDHPASFRLWIRTKFAEKIPARVVHYIDGDSLNIDAMLLEYSRLMTDAPIDLAFVGIGENGHIAFNDPHVADFDDPLMIKRVALDNACRQQQVNEGHFPDLASVPKEAISVSCTGLFRAQKWICCVPELRKAAAVKGSLEGPVTTSCPGSLVQRHHAASVFLDAESASMLSPAFMRERCRLAV